MENEWHRCILAENEEQYKNRLACYIWNIILSTDSVPENIFIQVKEAESDKITEKVMKYQRADGQFTFNGKFCQPEEIYEIIKPYCKIVSVSIVPKNRKEGDSFGYIRLVDAPKIIESGEIRGDNDV